MKKISITPGEVFGYLTVISEGEPIQSPSRQVRSVIAQCSCGTVTTIRLESLRNGRVKSCGCFRKEVTGNRARTHGMRGSRLYSIWCNMHTRCRNPNAPVYEYYGARGISVSPEWDTFEPFLNWAINNGYQDALTLDRIDNEQGYSSANCRWSTMKEQCTNRRLRRDSREYVYKL